MDFFFLLFFVTDVPSSSASDSLVSIDDSSDSDDWEFIAIPQVGQKFEPVLSAPQDLQNELIVSSWRIVV